MKLIERIESFSELGHILSEALEENSAKYTSKLVHLIEKQHLNNPWFTPDNVRMAFKSIAEVLTKENLEKWTGSYSEIDHIVKPGKVGVIMAGNIPLVGFHDLISVLITGNYLIAKTSSKDSDLIMFIGEIICDIDSRFIDRICFTEGTLTGFDSVIATGSDNSSRYFEYYFGKYPHIIRKNRNSIAIINGIETDSELEALGTDIFSYFGLGCRNVSKLFVPEGYDLSKMTEKWNSFSGLINHSKYANNYDFSKAVFLINKEKFNDTGFLILKESKSISSPVAVLNFERYRAADQVKIILKEMGEKIQCIVGRNYIPFGKAQKPDLWDYADGVDTIEFLLKKNSTGIL
jgi:hypothetical protein